MVRVCQGRRQALLVGVPRRVFLGQDFCHGLLRLLDPIAQVHLRPADELLDDSLGRHINCDLCVGCLSPEECFCPQSDFKRGMAMKFKLPAKMPAGLNISPLILRN